MNPPRCSTLFRAISRPRLSRFPSDGSARLLVRRSKNDRRGRGALLFLGRRTAQLVREWMAAAKVETGALFRRMHRAGSIGAEGMGIGSVRRVIVRRAKAAGVSGRVSGHSLRVGAAQSLARRGAGLVAMQKAGRWVSPVGRSQAQRQVVD